MRLLAATEKATSEGSYEWVEVQPHTYRLQTEGADLFLAARDRDGLPPYVFRAIDKAGTVLIEFTTGDYEEDNRPDSHLSRIHSLVSQQASANEPTLEALIQHLTNPPDTT